jgi:hypothetical protein
LSPGNIILVDDGTYNLTANILLTAADSGIIIEGFNSSSTVLSRGNINAGAYGFDIEGAKNVTIENLAIINSYGGIYVGDNTTSTGLNVSNVSVSLFYQEGIYIGPGNTGATIIANSIHDGTSVGVGYYGIYVINSQVSITNNTIYNTDLDDLFIQTGDNSVISGNTVRNSGGYGINADTATISNNIAYLDQGAGIYAYYSNVTGNTSYNNYGSGYYQAGIVDSYGLVANNIVYGNSDGLIISSSTTASGNRIYNNFTYGVYAQYGSNTSNNVIYSNAGGIFANGLVTITNNLIYANTSYGINLTGISSAVVDNNTIYQPTGDGVQLLPSYNPPTSVVVNDNIIWTMAGRDFYIIDSQAASFSSDYNDLYATGTGEIGNLSGEDFATLSAWTTELGRDRDSISADPQFVNIAGADGQLGYTGGVDHGADDNFNVQSTSPTIDAADPSLSYSAEPAPNGNRANQGYTGTTAQATTSAAQTIQLISPTQRVTVGQTVPITWNSAGLADPTPNTTYASVVESQSPLVYLKLDETGGTTAVDSSRNGLNGTYINSPQLGLTSPFGTGFGSAVGFNGGTSAVTVSSAALDLTNIVTITAWIKPTSFAPTWQAIFYKGVGDYTDRTYSIFLNTTGYILLDSFDASSGNERSLGTAAGSIPINTWTHIAVVMDRINGDAQIYLNGVLAASGAFPTTPAHDSAAQPLYVGNSPEVSPQFGPLQYYGEIDEAAVFGTALTPAQVSSEYFSTRGSYHIDLVNSSNVVVQSIVTGVHGAIYPNWTVSSSVTPGTYRLRVTSDLTGAIAGFSQPIMIVPAGHDYYVNDGSLTGDVTDTAVGNNANDGKSSNTPMASIEAVINTYHPAAGDTIHVENGTYNLYQNINIYTADSGLIIQGPTTAGGTALLNRNNTGAYVFFFADGTQNVTIDHLSMTGADVAVLAPDETIGVKNITVSNNIIFGNADAGISDNTNDSGWIISGNIVHDNTGSGQGIRVYATYGSVINNTIYNENSYGIFFNGSPYNPSVISGNNIYANYQGINSYYVTITGNLIHDNSNAGIVASNGLVSGNTVWRQTASGATGVVLGGAEARGNAIYGNYNGIWSRGADTIDDNRVYSNTNYGILLNSGYSQTLNNLIYDNSNGGIVDQSGYSDSIINNTVYQPVNDAINLQSSTNDTIENNILWIEAGYDLDVSPSSQSGLVSDYNILHHGTGSSANVGLWNGVSAAQLSDWQTASGQDTHSKNGDPLFVNPSGVDSVQGYNPTANNGNGYDGGGDDNFIVSAGSPAIGAGNVAVAPSTDLLGQSRTSPVDIGAYAYTGSSSGTTPPKINATTPSAINSSGSAMTVSSIVVTFSEPVNPVDANAVAEYDLRSAGPDGIFNTSDDVVYVITPAYTPGSTTVTLNFAGGPLPSGIYRLQILSSGNSTIHDLAGQALDGDSNGTAGGTYSRTFTIASATALTLTTPIGYIKLDADGLHIDVYSNSTGTGTPMQYLKSAASSLTITQTAAATIPFIIDLSAGNPLPSAGVTFNGNGTAGLRFIGSASASDSIVYTAAQMTIDGIVVNFTTPGTVSFRPGTGSDSLAVNSGTFTIAPSVGSTVTAANFSSINIASGANFTVSPGTTHATRYVLVVNALTIAGTSNGWNGTLDLNDNDLLIHNGNLTTLGNEVAYGSLFNTTHLGITSSVANQSTAHLTDLGVILNGTVFTTFDGQSAVSNDVLIKYTYIGDANLDGQVDGSDYTKIDLGFTNHLTGWLNGDFNYDGKIDGSDYSLIDNAFNRQGVHEAAIIAVPPVATAAQLAAVVKPVIITKQAPQSATPAVYTCTRLVPTIGKSVYIKPAAAVFSSTSISSTMIRRHHTDAITASVDDVIDFLANKAGE